MVVFSMWLSKCVTPSYIYHKTSRRYFFVGNLFAYLIQLLTKQLAWFNKKFSCYRSDPRFLYLCKNEVTSPRWQTCHLTISYKPDSFSCFVSFIFDEQFFFLNKDLKLPFKFSAQKPTTNCREACNRQYLVYISTPTDTDASGAALLVIQWRQILQKGCVDHWFSTRVLAKGNDE